MSTNASSAGEEGVVTAQSAVTYSRVRAMTQASPAGKKGAVTAKPAATYSRVGAMTEAPPAGEGAVTVQPAVAYSRVGAMPEASSAGAHVTDSVTDSEYDIHGGALRGLIAYHGYELVIPGGPTADSYDMHTPGDRRCGRPTPDERGLPGQEGAVTAQPAVVYSRRGAMKGTVKKGAVKAQAVAGAGLGQVRWPSTIPIIISDAVGYERTSSLEIFEGPKPRVPIITRANTAPPLTPTAVNQAWARRRLLDGLLNSRPKDVRLAIEDGVDVNFRDAWGDTPLHLAARSGKLRMATLLLDSGADPTITNRSGERAAEVSKTGEMMMTVYPNEAPGKRPLLGSEFSSSTFSESARNSDPKERVKHHPPSPWWILLAQNPVAFVCGIVHELSGELVMNAQRGTQ
mmetsp:Transcript_18942/g.48268  ORF Transcript_18942/g.48268 Transcript_18942/m.48268 type:complete len:401 (-) Transcript_18942:65-1267(-)|eukprot:CAMPEP_0179845022 /NCGR_PEP_ID=MMETSP0982-20121206/4683_1 /TAXON_ID=483367 /ORGANISM="non described non described, Strain CCMP 2436" /LENGTH=400 /DNA_ID=CAMNT_0021729823 /DNA_START=333 /DNA_END=1535 /DNA_ORIENTATION=+